MPDPQTAAALVALPRLCEAAGLPTEGWQARRANRRGASRNVTVLKLTASGRAPLILKRQTRPGYDFNSLMAEYRAAHAAFAHGAGLTIPDLLADDPGSFTCLMEYFPGDRLGTALHGLALKDQAVLLERAGRWMAAFHHARQGERRAYQTRYGLAEIARAMEQIEAGKARVAQPDLFRRAVERFRDMAPRWQGRPTEAAAQHGDLHLNNIMISDEAVAGIDFSGGHDAPVGHDIARLLVDYTILHAPLGQVRTGEVLPRAALNGFFAGYDLVGPDDPSVQMMLYMRILVDWRALPADPAAMRQTDARRLVGLIHMAQRAFGI